MEGLLSQLIEQCRPYAQNGKVASYIPALAQADPNSLGIYILDRNGLSSHDGESRTRFTIQSIIKPILLLQALMDNGETYVRSRLRGKQIELSREEGSGGAVTIHVTVDGLIQKFVFTPI